VSSSDVPLAITHLISSSEAKPFGAIKTVVTSYNYNLTDPTAI